MYVVRVEQERLSQTYLGAIVIAAHELQPAPAEMRPTKVVVSTFKPGEPVSEVDGYLGSARGRIPITFLFGHAVREDGKWLWYGNQQAE